MTVTFIASDPLVLPLFQASGGVPVYCDVGIQNELQAPVIFPPDPPPADSLADLDFPLDMYRFIIQEIRTKDLFGSPKPGTLFLKRYLAGPNEVWKQLVLDTQALATLWDVGEIDAQFLEFLKHIVGWTDETFLKKITDAIDNAALRRLISISGRLWNTRGPEDAMLNILRVLTGGNRLRIWNWFDFRWVLEETELGEEHEGRDAWIVDLPSSVQATLFVDSGASGNQAIGFSSSGASTPQLISALVKPGDVFTIKSGPQNGNSATILSINHIVPQSLMLFVQGATNTITGPFPFQEDWEITDTQFAPDDVYRSNLRIVDTTAAATDEREAFRSLVLRILRVMRAAGERIDITYLSFLDLFDVEADDLQWEPPAGGGNRLVEDGVLKLTAVAAEETFAIVTGSTAWREYVAAFRIRGTTTLSGGEFGAQFYRGSATNFYSFHVDTVSQTLVLRKTVNGIPTDIATIDLNAISFPVTAGVYYMYRVSIVDEGATNRIQLFIDGFQLVNTTDSAHSAGTVGLTRKTNCTMEVNEVEVFELALGTDTLDINEFP